MKEAQASGRRGRNNPADISLSGTELIQVSLRTVLGRMEGQRVEHGRPAEPAIQATPLFEGATAGKVRPGLSRPLVVTPEEDGERRSAHRLHTVFRIARVMRDRAAGLWRVRNISDFGMMMLTRMRPDKGERLSIALSDKVSIDARVVWCREDCCGVQFDEPIDSAALLKGLAAEQATRGHALRVRAPSPAARLSIELSGLLAAYPRIIQSIA